MTTQEAILAIIGVFGEGNRGSRDALAQSRRSGHPDRELDYVSCG